MNQFARARTWLADHVLPLWLERGVDHERGGFHETLALNGRPESPSRRAMVQARQIYSMRTAIALGVCEPAPARAAIASGARLLLDKYALSSGALVHSLDPDDKPANAVPELYTQAFALFGLAHAQAEDADPAFRTAALRLLDYLQRERRAPGGGYVELQTGQTPYQSNPHMHLFEAALAWMEIDADPRWRELADELLTLALESFIDPATGLLAEFFDAGWARQLDANRFVWEPGHQYEWAWLMGRYQQLAGRDLGAVRQRLYANAERAPRHPQYGAVLDQFWSDFTPKQASARFWPQCERIKTAVQMGNQAAADEAMNALFRYFDLPVQGLWYDVMEESGKFRVQAAKASSLYHIIGAIAEYGRLRV